jgi:hypothetical protein
MGLEIMRMMATENAVHLGHRDFQPFSFYPIPLHLAKMQLNWLINILNHFSFFSTEH